MKCYNNDCLYNRNSLCLKREISITDCGICKEMFSSSNIVSSIYNSKFYTAKSQEANMDYVFKKILNYKHKQIKTNLVKIDKSKGLISKK